MKDLQVLDSSTSTIQLAREDCNHNVVNEHNEILDKKVFSIHDILQACRGRETVSVSYLF